MKSEYVLPSLDLDAFNCPKCHVYAKQEWFHLSGAEHGSGYGLQIGDDRFIISRCARCGFPTIWFGEQLIFPLTSTAEPPNSDLPANIQADYEEARMISNLSPRAAAALLRLAIQTLCKHLGQAGTNINADIPPRCFADNMPLGSALGREFRGFSLRLTGSGYIAASSQSSSRFGGLVLRLASSRSGRGRWPNHQFEGTAAKRRFALLAPASAAPQLER